MKPELSNIENRWAVVLPDRFGELYERVPNATHVKLAAGNLFALPFSLLSPDEIAGAVDVAIDWELPRKVVPIIGDFHDLICLDYRKNLAPAVIALDDERDETLLFKVFSQFLDSLVSEPEGSANISGIISSRFDF